MAACPAGFYGEACNQSCSCRNGGICHPASGGCLCSPGWTGPNCQEGKITESRGALCCRLKKGFRIEISFLLPECSAGFYGADCQQRCLCQNGAACNKTDGACVCSSGWMGAACELGKPQFAFNRQKQKRKRVQKGVNVCIFSNQLITKETHS